MKYILGTLGLIVVILLYFLFEFFVMVSYYVAQAVSILWNFALMDTDFDDWCNNVRQKFYLLVIKWDKQNTMVFLVILFVFLPYVIILLNPYLIY